MPPDATSDRRAWDARAGDERCLIRLERLDSSRTRIGLRSIGCRVGTLRVPVIVAVTTLAAGKKKNAPKHRFLLNLPYLIYYVFALRESVLCHAHDIAFTYLARLHLTKTVCDKSSPTRKSRKNWWFLLGSGRQDIIPQPANRACFQPPGCIIAIHSKYLRVIYLGTLLHSSTLYAVHWYPRRSPTRIDVPRLRIPVAYLRQSANPSGSALITMVLSSIVKIVWSYADR